MLVKQKKPVFIIVFTIFFISLLCGCEANLEDTVVNKPLDQTQAPLCDAAKKMLAEGYEDRKSVV